MATRIDTHGVILSTSDSYKEILDKTEFIWTRENEFRGKAKLLVKAFNKYLASHREQMAASAAFLTQVAEIELPGSRKDIGWLLESTQHVFQQISAFQADLCERLTQDFLEPLSNFVDYKFQHLQYSQRSVRRSVREYRAISEQFEKVNSNPRESKVDVSKVTTLQRDMDRLRETIGERTGTFIEVNRRLNEVKKLELLRSFSSLLQRVHTYSMKSYDLFSSIMPQIVSLEETIHKDFVETGIKEGPLNIKRGNGWSREFCEINNGKFLSYRSDTKFSMDRVLDLQLCTVKPFLPEKEREKALALNCFQVITPGQKRPLVIQAESHEEKRSWEDAITTAIAVSLDNGSTEQQKSYVNNSTVNEHVVKILRTIPGNANCADCGADAPTWASINLGVVICLQCSGHHRSLGVHISKVRSLTLDHWDPELVMYMGLLGNERANRFFECNAMAGNFVRPEPDSDNESRKQWIMAKYKERAFIPPLSEGFDVNQKLAEIVTAKANDSEERVMQTVILLCYGAKVDQPDSDGKTLIMHAAMNDHWLIAQALIQHGADAFVTDNQHWSAFHYACFYNNYRILQVLARQALREKKASALLLQSDEDNPQDIAVRYNARECLMLLRGEMSMGGNTLDQLLNAASSAPLTSEVYEEITSPELMEEEKISFLDPLRDSSGSVGSSHPEDAERYGYGKRGDDPELQKQDSKSKIHLSLFNRHRKKDRESSRLRDKLALRRRTKSNSSTGSKEFTAPDFFFEAPESTQRSQSLETDPTPPMGRNRKKSLGNAILPEEDGLDSDEEDDDYDVVDTESEEEEEEEIPVPQPRRQAPRRTTVSVNGFDFPTST